MPLSLFDQQRRIGPEHVAFSADDGTPGARHHEQPLIRALVFISGVAPLSPGFNTI